MQESVNTHASKTQGRKQDYLVIHCTATPEGRNVTSAEIKIWHTSPPPKGNGWKHVGYTHIFHLNGGVEQLVANDDDGWVDTWEVTNGVAGYNSNSKHICVVGGLSKDGKTAKDTRTPEQKKSLEKFVKDFHKKHPTVHICGHNELASKACPSFDVQAWLKSIGIKNPKIY
ncbi:MAG: N-acetylmuramoyl-L-alanine amidase [Bacteroidales bacterium]|nr:N-acetylmuramoyl-L-alanine amidase [Bacteroidales bacterium]